jgi:segregation and condensation protein B
MSAETETPEPIVDREASEEIEEAVEAVVRPIEALLFVASEPLSIKQLAKLTRVSEVAVATALQRITEVYADRGIAVREIGGGYRFATTPLARDAVEAYLLPPKSNLSTPALEALAIVAHMQPVTKGEIESIRGVNSDSVVSTLMDRNLILEAGRKDVVGRPMQYKTTAVFLESFGLRSLDDLPQLELEPGQPLELDLISASFAPLLPEAPEVSEGLA